MPPARSPEVCRILLIEDDPDDVIFLRRALDGPPELPVVFAVSVATRLEQGLDALASEPYGMVLLDLTLPGTSGLDTLETLLGRFPDAAVVVLTGHDGERVALDALSRGAQDYLVKGASAPGALKRAVLHALARARLAAQGRRVDALTAEVVERRRVDDLKDRFFGEASHELRSPVTVVRAALAVLREGGAGPLSAEQQLIADLAMRNVMHLARMLEDFLDLSRLESGMARLEKSWFDPRPLLEEVVRGYDLVGRRRGVRIELRVPDPATAVHADPDMLRRTLSNLLDNALRFAGARIMVSLVSGRPGPETAEFAIEDDGPGIPADRLPHLFQRFAQADRAPAEGGYEGTGLGLSLVKQMVELNGGRIRAESPSGGGARLCFHLPAAAAAPNA